MSAPTLREQVFTHAQMLADAAASKPGLTATSLDDFVDLVVEKLLPTATAGTAGSVWATAQLCAAIGWHSASVPPAKDGSPSEVVHFEGNDGHTYVARVVGVTR
jgi:hypothetical protein